MEKKMALIPDFYSISMVVIYLLAWGWIVILEISLFRIMTTHTFKFNFN